jgi:alkanesulfonate monooxygenase SsuD/methylene tetrahydromethanopterin reductase-like flavin-dependent oxidoreductase (luciferase family)
MYEVCVTEPITRTGELAVFQGLLDQVRAADELGFEAVWHTEHHFMREYAHSSAQDVILGAYAGVTENIRLGFGVKLLPFGFNHPIKAAESAATLDLMSSGRVDFGTGRGLTAFEFDAFKVDPHKARAEWRESIDMIVQCWEDKEFSWNSPNFQIDPVHVVPKPVQQPHPPIWQACTSPDSHRLAGELGMGLLSLVLMTPVDELARRIGLYKEGLAQCTAPVGKYINDQVGAFLTVYCAETDDEARDIAADAFLYYIKHGFEYVGTLAKKMAGSNEPTYKYLQDIFQFDFETLTFDFLDNNDMCIVGSPETCIKKLQKYEDIGVTQILAYMQGRGMTNQQVLDSIQLIGKEVIPAFQ